MIVLALAAALNLFTLAATPDGVTSSFALNGFTTDTQGIQTVTTAAPTLKRDADGDTLELSFISPVKGMCVAADMVSKDDDIVAIPLGQAQMNKGATMITVLDLPADDDVTDAGGKPDGYNVFVVCKSDADDKTYFSNFYHINAPALKPA